VRLLRLALLAWLGLVAVPGRPAHAEAIHEAALRGTAGGAAAPDTVPGPTAYQLRHSWFSRDKAYHFLVSGAGAAAVYGAGRELGLSRRGAALGATLVVGAAGILREALAVDDETRLLSAELFSRRDMVWNAAGIVVGITVTDALLRERWRRSRASPAGAAAIVDGGSARLVSSAGTPVPVPDSQVAGPVSQSLPE
jgi:uncharacterized protein YfiM (DUF2279 family)